MRTAEINVSFVVERQKLSYNWCELNSNAESQLCDFRLGSQQPSGCRCLGST